MSLHNMEYSFGACVIFILIFQIERIVCESQEVVFEIKDGELNQVIFRGERDITLICHVSNTLHAVVTISETGRGSVASNNAIGNCLEYTIPEVIEQNEYSCMARYRDVNTGQIVEMSKLLSLNVRHTSRSVCFRNGTMSQEEYGEGDRLLLSCYCMDVLGCFWSETKVGSELGKVVQDKPTYQHNNKVLLQIVVGPLTSMDVRTRYDCVHGSQSIERCSIGPADVSRNDTVLQHISRSGHLEGCPPMVTPITGTIPEALPSTSDEMKDTDSSTSDKIKPAMTDQDQQKAEAKEDFPLYILIIVTVLMVLIFVAMLLFILFIRKNKGKKASQNHDKDHDKTQDRNSHDQEEINANISPIYAQPVKNIPQFIADVSCYNVSNTIRIDDDNAGDEADEVCIPEVVEYNIPVAFRRDAVDENGDADEGEGFCIPEVLEYNIPVAFRRDAFGENARQLGESEHGSRSIIY